MLMIGGSSEGRYPRTMTGRPLPPGVVPVAPGPGQESVWDYPRPPRVEAATARVRVVVDGHVLAASDRALRVLETAGAPVYYIPAEDVDPVAPPGRRPNDRCASGKVGRPTSTTTTASGRSRRSPGRTAIRRPDYDRIRDHVAFYASRVDEAWLGEERATAQPGGFYGGWVTAAIVGPIKGEPGSEGWYRSLVRAIGAAADVPVARVQCGCKRTTRRSRLSVTRGERPWLRRERTGMGRESERRLTLVLNPPDDEAFRRLAERLVAGGSTEPRSCRTACARSYPLVAVRPRELAGERAQIWYVYREGHWIRRRADG